MGQNTRDAHFQLFSMAGFLHCFVTAACLFVLCLFAIACPETAHAQEYGVSRVDIAAEISDAGDLHVVETRQLDFPGESSVIVWPLPGVSGSSSVQVNGVTLQDESEASDGARTLSDIPFTPEWRDGSHTATEVYSWDGLGNALYLCLPKADGGVSVSVDYTVLNAVAAYKDIGELYWRYVPAQWPVDSENVHARITLPNAEVLDVRAGDNVRAWGHGPEGGTVDFTEDGAIVYEVPAVRAGQYAEARVVFPVSWLPSLRTSALELHENESRLESVLADERSWVDTGNAQGFQGIMFNALWVAVALVLLAWGVFMYLRWGREPNPRFGGGHWREAPDEELSPAVIGRLLNWNVPDARQFGATLLHLAARGVLRMEPLAGSETADGIDSEYGESGVPARKEAAEAVSSGKRDCDAACDLVFTALWDEDTGKMTPSEAGLLKLLFEVIGDGADGVRLSQIDAYASRHPDEFALHREAWHALLSQEVGEAAIFEAKGASRGARMRVVAGVYAAVAIIAVMSASNPLLLLPALPSCLALLLLSRFMMRRTQRGADAAARAQALKGWLEQGSERERERESLDAAATAALAPYVFLFGIRADDILDPSLASRLEMLSVQ